jgi:hypothetical protein
MRLVDPCRNRRVGRLGQFELNRSLRLALHDHCSRQNLITVGNVANTQGHEVAASQIALDCQIEHSNVPNVVLVL